MLRYIIMAVAAAAIFGIGWPLATSAFGSKPKEAANLVEATQRTNNKADSLNRSFTDVIPPAPQPANAYAVPVQQPTPGEPEPQGPGAVPTAPGQQPPGANPEEIPPTPDYSQYTHKSEHAVRDAIEYLNRLQQELEPSQTQYIQAVEQLQRAWAPRYSKAVQEYKRFAYRIDHADAMANDYFTVQQNLTEQITNSQDRRRAQERDLAEHRVYLDWREQAFRTLGQAQLIMNDLHDMNIVITKQRLSAHFAALYEDFQQIPPAITLLHRELERFRKESERIQKTFGVNPS